jgi:hypothetical protein
VRRGRLGELEGALDDRTQPMPGGHGRDAFAQKSGERELFFEGARAQDGAEEVNALAQHEAEVELGARAGAEADQHDAGAGGAGAQGLGQVRAADQVEHDVDAPPARGLEHLAGEALAAGDDADREAEVGAALELLEGARGADDEGARARGELQGGGAHAAAGGVHEHALAGLELRLGEEGVVGGQAGLGQGGGLEIAQALGHGARLALVHDEQLGVGAAAHDAEDAAAGGERAHALAHRLDDAGVFEAGHVGGGAGRGGVGPAALQGVGAVDARVADRDAHVAGGHGRVGHVVNFEDFGPAGGADDDGSHDVGL